MKRNRGRTIHSIWWRICLFHALTWGNMGYAFPVERYVYESATITAVERDEPIEKSHATPLSESDNQLSEIRWYHQPVYLIVLTVMGLSIGYLIYLHIHHYIHLGQIILERTATLRYANEQLELHKKQLQQLTVELSNTEERERRRIAAELHDRIGQALAMSQIKIQSLRSRESSMEIQHELEELNETISQTINDTQTLIFELSPTILYDLGLEPAIAWLVEHIENHHPITIRYQYDQVSENLDHDLRTFLFRAVRELLINIVKHASASQAIVRIEHIQNTLCIDIEDNGIGINKIADPNKNGFGLFYIRERVALYKGLFLLDTCEIEGTCISIIVPVKKEIS